VKKEAYIDKWLKIPMYIKQVINTYMRSNNIKPSYITTITPEGTNYKVKVNIYSLAKLKNQLSNKRKSNALEVAITYMEEDKLINYVVKKPIDYKVRLQNQERDENAIYSLISTSPLKYRIYRLFGKGDVLEGEEDFYVYYSDEHYKIANFIEDWKETKTMKSLAKALKEKLVYKGKSLNSLTTLLYAIKDGYPSTNISRIKNMSKIRKAIKILEKENNEN